jgi:hypothetical protein
MVIAAQNKLHTMTTDIANALCSYGTLYGEICSIAGKLKKDKDQKSVYLMAPKLLVNQFMSFWVH